MKERATAEIPRERGVALILAFLTVLILVVVMGEIAVRGSVELQRARQELQTLRQDYAARAGFEYAKSLLLRDLIEPRVEEVGLSAAVPLAAFAGVEGFDLELPARPASSPVPRFREPSTGPLDSFNDLWADPEACRIHLDGGVAIELRIEDCGV